MRIRLIAAAVAACAASVFQVHAAKVNLCATDVYPGSGMNLDAAIAAGGTITFEDCGTATITMTKMHTIGPVTTIDGGNRITLDAGGTTPVLALLSNDAGVHLTLKNIVIRHGQTTAPSVLQVSAGVIWGHGSVLLDHVTITDSVDPVGLTSGQITVRDSQFLTTKGLSSST